MHFWGIQVKPGQTVKCFREHYFVLHITQAVLVQSDVESEADKATLYIKPGSDPEEIAMGVRREQIAIGVLSADKFPQVHLDLFFEQAFELSHTSKTANVFFSGYYNYKPRV